MGQAKPQSQSKTQAQTPSKSNDVINSSRTDDKKKPTGSSRAPSRVMRLFCHDLQAYGAGQAMVPGVQIARLWIGGQLIIDSERYSCVLQRKIVEARPFTPEEENLVKTYEAMVETYNKDKEKYDKDSAQYAKDNAAYETEQRQLRQKKIKEATLTKPEAPTEPTPPTLLPEIKAAYKAIADWTTFISQVKAGLDLDEAAPEKLFTQKLTSVLQTFGAQGSYSWHDQALRQKLVGYLEKKVGEYGKRFKDGVLVVNLPNAELGERVDIKFELAGLKFTKPVEKLSELGLDLGFAQRSAIYYPPHAQPPALPGSDPDWWANRQKVSAWKARCEKTGVETEIYNSYDFTHEWKTTMKEPEPLDLHVFVMQWCQPVWYRRIARHGQTPIAPLELPPSNSDPAVVIKPPVINGVPTMMVSTSDTYPHAKFYGRFGRQGRRKDCEHVRTLVRSGDYYRYPKHKLITPCPKIADEPADWPGEPVSVRTFQRQEIQPTAAELKKNKKAKPVQRWVQISPDPKECETPPGTVRDLKALPGEVGEVRELQIYSKGTKNLVEALQTLYADLGGDKVLKKEGTSKYHDEYRRMMVREVDEKELSKDEDKQEVKCWRAVGFTGADKKTGLYGLMKDPNYEKPLTSKVQAEKQTRYRWHQGVDVATTVGEPVFAMFGGMATWREDKAIGGVVGLRQGNYLSEYLHCLVTDTYWSKGLQNHPGGSPGAPVKAGDVLALAGRTGNEHNNQAPTHAHMQKSGITNGLEFFDASHKRMLPSEYLIEELFCQSEVGQGPKGGEPVHTKFPVQKCWGRTRTPGAPLPEFRPHMDFLVAIDAENPERPNDWVFTKTWKENPSGPTCWAFNEKRCPIQDLVEGERQRRWDWEAANPPKSAKTGKKK